MAEYYAKTTRAMLASVKEVGAMPFILFEYYLTWQSASGGIKPGLQRIADDLGLEKNAVCNLRSKLIKAGWVRYENEEIFITKSFTKNESDSQKMNETDENDSQKMNDHSQKMNESFTKNERSFTKNESPYKEENKQEKEHTERTEREKPRSLASRAVVDSSTVNGIPLDRFHRSRRNLYAESEEPLATVESDCEAVRLFEEVFRVRAGTNFINACEKRVTDLAAWRKVLENKSAYADGNEYERRQVTKWILNAYDEYLEKGDKNGNNGKKSNGDIYDQWNNVLAETF
jgi:hypothetical protein